MSKRIIALLCAALMLVSVFSLSACKKDKKDGNDATDSGVTGTTKEGFTYSVDTDGIATITGYTEKMKAYPTIPDMADEKYPIKKIGAGAFKDCQIITGLDAFEIEEIGDEAFSGCSVLRSVDLTHVKVIGKHVFRGCSFMTNIKIGESNETYKVDDGRVIYTKDGSELVAYPSADEKIKLKKSVVSIAPSAFEDCNGLTSIDMPGVEVIGESAFANCYSLKTVKSPALSYIATNAFNNDMKLESIDLEKVNTIENSVFMQCSSLKEANLESIREIGEYAFMMCESLSKLTIGKSCEILRAGAFNSCTKLKVATFKGDAPQTVGMMFDGTAEGFHIVHEKNAQGWETEWYGYKTENAK